MMLGLAVSLGSVRPLAAFSTPADYDPTLWYDFTVTASMKDAGGSPADLAEAIATWEDQSGNGYHIGETLDANDRPTRTADGVSFDGTDDYLTSFGQSTTNVLNSVSTTVYMVVRIDTLAHFKFLWNNGGGAAPFAKTLEYDTGKYRVYGAGDKPATGNGSDLVAGQFYVLTIRTGVNFVGITLDDGTEIADTSTQTPTATRLSLAASSGIPGTACADCTIKEVIGFSELHSDAKRSNVIEYLMAKHLTVLMVGGLSLMLNGSELGIFGL